MDDTERDVDGGASTIVAAVAACWSSRYWYSGCGVVDANDNDDAVERADSGTDDGVWFARHILAARPMPPESSVGTVDANEVADDDDGALV